MTHGAILIIDEDVRLGALVLDELRDGPWPWRRSTRPEKTRSSFGLFMSAPLASTLLSASLSAVVWVLSFRVVGAAMPWW